MKIVHIAHTYLDNYSYQENELPEVQARLGSEVTVISTQDYAHCFNYQVPDLSLLDSYCYYIGQCKIVRLPLKFNVNYRFAMYKGLFKTLVAEHPDLIFFHEIPYFCLWDVIKYLKKEPHCQLFVDYHCDEYNFGHNMLSRLFLHKCLYRLMVKLTDKYVKIRYVVTPSTGIFIKKMYGIDDSKIKLLPLGGDLKKMNVCNAAKIRKEIRAELGINDQDILIVSAGKMNREKNIHLLIQAYNKLIKTRDVKLLLVGSVENAQYLGELKKLAHNDPNVFFLGWQSSSMVYNFFMASDIACFPGSQSVLWQQAICCGLPLICKYWEGSEYLNVAHNVLFVQKDTVDELQKQIQYLISNPQILEKMKHVVEMEAREYFNYDRIAMSISEDYYLQKSVLE